jgi:predicted glycosyltransferase
VRVWVDLTNSPHALFFAPIVRALQARGDEVLVTARHFAQTVELAGKHFQQVVPVGSGSRASLPKKVYSLGDRVRELTPIVRAFAPDVAVAHGSYDEPIVSRLLGIPALAMVDYEYHPATHLLFRLATRLLLPEAFSADLVNSHGGRGKTWRYHGLKEEVYLAGLVPSEEVRVELGIAEHDGPVVALRPPAVGAMYHRHDNPLWTTLIDRLRAERDALTLVLPRHPSQVDALRSLVSAPNIRVLDRPVDGPSLVWWSDVMVSAGGTMNREAVALGTPVWTVFSGRLGSVDAELISSGRMGRIAGPQDIDGLVIRRKPPQTRPTFTNDVLGQVVAAIDRTARVTRRPVLPARRPGRPADGPRP